MKKITSILIITAFSLVGCSKIEPIEVITPTRNIDTQHLTLYKSDLKNRNVSIGMVYGWGKQNQSVLMHTPDSLDIIVVKDGYFNINDYQKTDLQQVRKEKATKVLLGIDLKEKSELYSQSLEKTIYALITEKRKEIEKSDDFLTSEQLNQIIAEIQSNATANAENQERESLQKLLEDVLQQVKNFDGVSIEFPENFNSVYSAEALSNFTLQIEEVAGNDKEKILILENPYPLEPSVIEKADWVICRQNLGAQTLGEFTDKANQWNQSLFVPSIDFYEENLSDGYSDTSIFPVQAQNVELCSQGTLTKAGVAFYHIEKDYSNISGKNTYKTLRESIHQLQIK